MIRIVKDSLSMTILGFSLIVRLSNLTYIKSSILRECIGIAVLDLSFNHDVTLRDTKPITSKLNV
jgi:hypothetical protein